MKCSKFTAGIASGFILGLLLAPKKGKDTRKMVKETAESWKHKINQLFGKGEIELDELQEILEYEAEELNADVRKKLLRLIEENRKTYQQAKHQTLS